MRGKKQYDDFGVKKCEFSNKNVGLSHFFWVKVAQDTIKSSHFRPVILLSSPKIAHILINEKKEIIFIIQFSYTKLSEGISHL